MKTPWGHDRRTVSPGFEREPSGTKGAFKLAAVLWLLVGAAALGLYIGWNVSPQETTTPDAPAAAPPPLVVQHAESQLTVLMRTGGTRAGLVVDLADPGIAVRVNGDEIVVL